MSYINRQRNVAWSMSKTHLLTVWLAANQFPITMPLDQSAVNYTAQKGEARFRRLRSADHHVSVSL